MIDRRGFIGAVAGAIAFGKMPGLKVSDLPRIDLRNLRWYVILGDSWSDLDENIGTHCELLRWDTENCKHTTTLMVRTIDAYMDEGEVRCRNSFSSMKNCLSGEDADKKLWDMFLGCLKSNGVDRKLGISYTDGIPVRFRLDHHPWGTLHVD